MTLSIPISRYIDSQYAECHILFIFMLNAIMATVVKLNVFMLSVVAPFLKAKPKVYSMFCL
jgi:hypothetical protein